MLNIEFDACWKKGSRWEFDVWMPFAVNAPLSQAWQVCLEKLDLSPKSTTYTLERLIYEFSFSLSLHFFGSCDCSGVHTGCVDWRLCCHYKWEVKANARRPEFQASVSGTLVILRGSTWDLHHFHLYINFHPFVCGRQALVNRKKTKTKEEEQSLPTDSCLVWTPPAECGFMNHTRYYTRLVGMQLYTSVTYSLENTVPSIIHQVGHEWRHPLL